MAFPSAEACAYCHIEFGTHEARVAHNGKPYHEDCVKETGRKSPRLKISELLMVIDRQGIHIEPRHHIRRRF